MPDEIHVENCARCDGDHSVQVERFTNPTTCRGCGREHTHFGVCPDTGEPILVRFEEVPDDA